MAQPPLHARPASPPLPSQLPEDVRALEECPFPVQWQPVVSILQFQAPDIDGPALRSTLLRKEKVRLLQLYDLVLRLDPATQLYTDVRAAMETHLNAVPGNTLESFL